MKLDRGSIERRDFPQSRKGYDPGEVQAHLSAVADAVEQLKRGTASGTAAARVQAVIEAAEQSAGEIETAAREDAAEQMRRSEQAIALVNQASAELTKLQAALNELRDPSREPEQAQAAQPAQPAPAKGEQAEAKAEPDKAEAEEDEPQVVTAAERVAAQKAAEEKAAEQEGPGKGAQAPADAKAVKQAPKGAQGKGIEGARLIALNMALNGSSREETASYLQDNFELDDADALLDDVYSG